MYYNGMFCIVMLYIFYNVICHVFVISCIIRLYVWHCSFLQSALCALRERRMLCFVLSPQAWNFNVICKRRICVLYVVSTSVECCALYCLHQRGTVCFVLSPRAGNCNVIHKCGIVCFMYTVSVSTKILCFVLSPPAVREVVAAMCQCCHCV